MRRVFGNLLICATAILMVGCMTKSAPVNQNVAPAPTAKPPELPLTLAEIIDDQNTKTDSPLYEFDFLNYTYPLPRGWQDIDSKEITLEDGKRRVTDKRIGMTYITSKYGDVTGDGEDEAFVILRVRTGGSATPHFVYIFEWQDGEPEIIWYFRTGDRADGGLKRVYADGGGLMIELFGQDRYIFSQMETLKILGDEPQLCCPLHFTRIRYKRNNTGFIMDGKRLTYSMKNPDLPPLENLGEQKLKEYRGKD